MPEEYQNIYKTARRASGYTQEAAAERLGISVESVRSYETAQRIPPNHVVERMAILYNAHYLAYQHLHETNVLMDSVIPALTQRDLLIMAVRIYNRIRRLHQANRLDRLIEIAEDGHIDEEERPEYDAIMQDLRDIVQAGLEMEVFCSDYSGCK